MAAALEGEALFVWLYERRENKEDELSWNQFGDFTPADVDGLKSDWFPGSAIKRGQLQSAWTNHPTNNQAVAAAPQVHFPKELLKVLEKQGEVMVAVLELLDKDAYDDISESSNSRKLKQDDYLSTYGVSSKSDLQCMITGLSQTSISRGGPMLPNPVTLTHLLPCCSKSNERVSLGYEISDIENIRNSLLLCKGIKQAFDQKQISFVPVDNPFSVSRYKLHIWRDDVRGKSIYEGASQTIGDYDSVALDLSINTHTHNPFNRALSYQAFCAFKSYGKEFELPVDSDISIYQGTYQSKRAEYARQLAKDIAADAENEDDEV